MIEAVQRCFFFLLCGRTEDEMHGRWIISKVNKKYINFSSMFFLSQVQVAEPGGGRVLQRSHPRGGRRQPGAPTEV